MTSAAPTASTPTNVLHGARVAFTGRLATVARRRAYELAREAGAEPVESLSRRVSFLVVGMRGLPLRSDGRMSAKLERAERMRRSGQPIEIISEMRFLTLTGAREAPGRGKSYPLSHVAEVVGVEPGEIARWEYMGLVESVDGRYDFQDIVSLQTIASLVDRGVDPRRIRRSLESLAGFVTGTDRPLAQLRVIESGSGEVLARLGDALVAPDGQQMLDFERPDERASTDAPAGELTDASDELFEEATWLEEEERPEEAADRYRRVIALAPGRVEAYFNLGNVLATMDRYDAAEEMYRLTLAFDSGHGRAWYNLADLLEEEERLDEAAECLRHAIAANAQFADAHFNLAACLEQMGQNEAAAEHWRAYLALDSTSEWAAIARRRLDEIG